MVLITHLHGRVGLFSSLLIGTLFSSFGYLAVSGFFFLSGYGLYEQSKKSDSYIKNFPIKKILPFYLLCCTVIVIYLLRDLIVGDLPNALDLAHTFSWGGTIVDNGWYLQTQLLLYVFFYITFRWLKKYDNIVLFVLLVAYSILCMAFGYTSTWYESVFAFWTGILCSKYREKVVEFLQHKAKVSITFITLFLFFVITLFFGNKPFLPTELRIIVKMLSAISFTATIVIILSRVNIVCAVTKFLGKYSLEIYVLQGIFLSAYRGIIPNDWLYILAVVISVISAAVLAKPILNRVGSLPFKKPRSIQ